MQSSAASLRHRSSYLLHVKLYNMPAHIIHYAHGYASTGIDPRARQKKLILVKDHCKRATYALPFKFFGALTFCVGGGNGTRLPPENMMGLHSWGTLSCITGLFLYRSTKADRPCCLSFQTTRHAAVLDAPQVKPSKCERMLWASSGVAMFTNAKSMAASVSKATGR